MNYGIISFLISISLFFGFYFIYKQKTGKSLRDLIEEMFFEEDKTKVLSDRIDMLEIEIKNLKKEMEEFKNKNNFKSIDSFEKIFENSKSDIEQNVINMRKNGLKIKEISEKLNIKPSKVCYIVKKHSQNQILN
jgi:cell division protein FtsB